MKAEEVKKVLDILTNQEIMNNIIGSIHKDAMSINEFLAFNSLDFYTLINEEYKVNYPSLNE